MNAPVVFPSSAPAITYPDTEAAVAGKDFGRRALLWLGLIGTVLSIPGSLACIELGDPEYSTAVRHSAGYGVVLCMLLFCLGPLLSFFMWRKRRVVRILRTHPWVVWRIDYTYKPPEKIVMRDVQGTPMSELTISSTGPQRRSVVDENSTHVWFAGDPLRSGVIARPGGSYPLYVFGHPLKESDRRAEESAPKPKLPVDLPPHLKPPRFWRAAAFFLDLLIHLACGASAAVAVTKPGSVDALLALEFDFSRAVLPFLGGWVGASFIDRVLLQSWLHTTLGKALFGLCVLDPETLRFPTFGRLTGAWFIGAYMSIFLPICVATLSDVPGPDEPKRYTLPATRRRFLVDQRSS